MKKNVLSVAAVLLCITMLFTGCGKSEAVYSAGTYSASSEGYAGPVAVEVEFDEYSITAVRVISHNETPNIADKAIDDLPRKIVNAQSWDVEAVTSATVTSSAIKEAVKNCVEQAVIKK